MSIDDVLASPMISEPLICAIAAWLPTAAAHCPANARSSWTLLERAEIQPHPSTGTIGRAEPQTSLDETFRRGNNLMRWEVEYTDEFEQWWSSLEDDERESLDASVAILAAHGPLLGFPHSSGMKGSKHRHMRELRTQHNGRPLRRLYAFDPRRCAVLLIGGDKTGDDRWYTTHIPVADRLYDEHLM